MWTRIIPKQRIIIMVVDASAPAMASIGKSGMCYSETCL